MSFRLVQTCRRPALRATRALIPGLLLATWAVGVRAQAVDSSTIMDAARMSDSSVIALGDSLHHALEPEAALRVFSEALPDSGGAAPLLWRAARESVHLGMLAEEDEVRSERFTRAVDWAERAVAADSTAAEAWAWLGVALGRRALVGGLRTRARLGNEVRNAAERGLALDSTSARAHHVLGQWHAEIERLNVFERIGARAMGAEGLGDASWDAAVDHLETAVRLEPDVLIHRLVLARIYDDLDRDADARAQAQAVLDHPVSEPADPLHRERARALLDELGSGAADPPAADGEARISLRAGASPYSGWRRRPSPSPLRRVRPSGPRLRPAGSLPSV